MFSIIITERKEQDEKLKKAQERQKEEEVKMEDDKD